MEADQTCGPHRGIEVRKEQLPRLSVRHLNEGDWRLRPVVFHEGSCTGRDRRHGLSILATEFISHERVDRNLSASPPARSWHTAHLWCSRRLQPGTHAA